jgi:endonuclease G
MTQLLLIHGRDQQGKDPERLRREWVAGLAKGLTLAGRTLPAMGDIVFPYYGDWLSEQLLQQAKLGMASLNINEIESFESAATQESLDAEVAGIAGALIVDTAREAGFTPPPGGEPDRLEAEGLEDLMGIRAIREALAFLARKTGIAELWITHVLKDVAVYLSRSEVRDGVLRIAGEGIRPDEPVVVVGHSLGSVVAFDLLTRLEGFEIPLLLTAGSPLGLPIVRRHLLSSEYPKGVGRWMNAYDRRDVVAIAGALRPIYGGGVLDEVTVNQAGPHSIQDYLSDPDVAGAVADAMGLGAT